MGRRCCVKRAKRKGVPFEFVRDLPPKARRLLGYASYDPAPHHGGRLWLVDFDEAALRYG